MKVCIGIISYLPDDKVKRAHRIGKLNSLLLQCDTLFKLPIVVVAQNWDEISLPALSNSKMIIYNYSDKLGITEARRVLRNIFIKSEYDYLIMLDDDIKLVGTQTGFDLYLNKINNNPGKYGIFKSLTLQLFAISKDMYSKIDFPNGDPLDGDFFEDMWLIMALEKLYPKNKFNFDRGLIDAVGDAAKDPDSTWYYGQINKHKIGDNTREMISKLC